MPRAPKASTIAPYGGEKRHRRIERKFQRIFPHYSHYRFYPCFLERVQSGENQGNKRDFDGEPGDFAESKRSAANDDIFDRADQFRTVYSGAIRDIKPPVQNYLPEKLSERSEFFEEK